MLQRILIAIKGALMGLADMVPGVSGGTVALVVGIYRPFVDALRSLHLAWVPPLAAWLASGMRKTDARHRFTASWRSMHLGFLLTLGLGMAAAVVVMVNVIPPLMQAYPQAMRGLFFGLVAASVVVPWRMIGKERGPRLVAVFVVAALATYLLLGAQASPWVERERVVVEADGTSLAELAREQRSTATPRELYAGFDPAVREAIREANPAFDEARESNAEVGDAFDRLHLPAGLAVEVPRPALWYVLICGAIAICAMLLPGVSGSFILVMFGMYYVMANTLRTTLHGTLDWVRGAAPLPFEHGLLVAVFLCGALAGLLGAARLLSWLLHHATLSRPTLAVLAGLMLGSLGVLWPYKDGPQVDARNVLPRTLEEPATWLPLLLMLLGAALVALLHWFGTRVAPTPGPAHRQESESER